MSPLHTFKETPQADRAALAVELEETIRQSHLKLGGALEFYTSLPRLAEAPDSFAFARDRALSLSATVISLTEQSFEHTFRWRLLEDTLPDSLNDRLYAVRYLRENAQNLAAFVELNEFDRAMQLAESWRAKVRKDSALDEAKVWDAQVKAAFGILPALREQALKGIQSVLEFSELFYRTGRDGSPRLLRTEDLSELELKGVQATLEERLEQARIELQDAEYCATVLNLQAHTAVELLEELLQIEREGVLAEIVTDLRTLARSSPQLADLPIQMLMFLREQYVTEDGSLPTIGERIRSLSSIPEVLAFVRYEGTELLLHSLDQSEVSSEDTPAGGLVSEAMSLSSMPLSVLRVHSRLLQRVLRLQNLRLKLAWASSCSGYLPLSLANRYFIGPSAADDDLKELTVNIESLGELLDAHASSREYRGRDVPFTRVLWSQMQDCVSSSFRLLEHVKFLGTLYASSSRVQMVDDQVQTSYGFDPVKLANYLMNNLKAAR